LKKNDVKKINNTQLCVNIFTSIADFFLANIALDRIENFGNRLNSGLT